MKSAKKKDQTLPHKKEGLKKRLKKKRLKKENLKRKP